MKTSGQNKKNVLFIILAFLIVLASISTIFYVNLKKRQTINVEATVKLVGNNYIIAESDEKEEYSLKTEDDFNVGDKISFTIKDIKKDSYPKEGTVIKIDTISKSINFSITDTIINSDGEEAVITNKQDEFENTTESTNTEEDVISYLETLNNNLDTYNQDKSISESLKNGFITVVDFLFYNGEIKGFTFGELSTTAKLKVLQLAFSIDEKIDKYFPGYKEQISTTSQKIYTNVKTKATELYLDITTTVCKNDPDTCKYAKEGLSNLKSSFSLTWDFIKEISGIGLSKLKAWYEVWKSC